MFKTTRRRLYDILNILEGFGFVKHLKKNQWIRGHGIPYSKLARMIRCRMELPDRRKYDVHKVWTAMPQIIKITLSIGNP